MSTSLTPALCLLSIALCSCGVLKHKGSTAVTPPKAQAPTVGITWSGTNPLAGAANPEVIDVFADGATVYAASSSGLWLSKDGGKTWANKTTADGLGDDDVQSVYAANGKIYAGTWKGLAVSEDGGNTWMNKTSLLPNSVGGGYPSIAGQDADVFLAGTPGIIVSHDNGQSWSAIGTAQGLSESLVESVFVDGKNVYASTTVGLSTSSDSGKTWTNLTNFEHTFYAGTRCVAEYQATIYACGDGILTSHDGGASWTMVSEVQGLPSDMVTALAKSHDVIFAGTYSKGLEISADNGVSWTTKTTADGLASNAINSIAVDGSTIYVATDLGLSIGTIGP